MAAWRRLRSDIIRAHLSPPPRLTVSEWADRHRVVSSYSAEPGPWRTDRTPYLREPMDSFSDPSVTMVVVQKCARIGGTEAGLNIVGYFIDQDPSQILVVQPTVDDAKDFSKEQLAPMIADTPCLARTVRDPKARDSGNTVQAKVFTGGGLYLVGANSPRGFRRRTARVLDLEEVDGYPPSAGTEGDQVKLAMRRTATFGYRRKVYMNSTPTLKGLSRIEDYALRGDQRHYHIPCPDCGAEHRLVWGNLKFEEGGEPRYLCESCGVLWPEEAKFAAMARGRWVPSNPGAPYRSYYINALYSPWVTWREIVDEWREAQGDTAKLQVFVNTVLGETWEERGGGLDAGALEQRREVYGAEVPLGVGVLVMGVDVQDDRLEATVWGTGAFDESWVVRHLVIRGDPETDGPWAELETWRTRDWAHEGGKPIRVLVTCVDSGAHTEAVYRYVKPRYAQRVYATKGASQPGRPMVSRKPSVNNKHRVRLFLVGTETGKDTVYGRLKVVTPGPYYVHFPVADWSDAAYFAQLTSNKVVKEYVNGRWVRRYKLPHGLADEALDCAVLCLVALALAPVPRERLGQEAARYVVGEPVAAAPEPVQTRFPVPVRRRQSWMRWR